VPILGISYADVASGVATYYGGAGNNHPGGSNGDRRKLAGAAAKKLGDVDMAKL